jgi:hypothetical protein
MEPLSLAAEVNSLVSRRVTRGFEALTTVFTGPHLVST